MSMRKLKQELDDLKYELYDLHHIEPNPTMYVQKRDELEYKIVCLEDKIELSINHLPLQTKKVFQLKRREELSYEEISSQLNISVNTVKYHMKSALQTLRVELATYMISIVLIFIL